MTPFLQSTALCQLSHVRHGFFTREGGVSQGIFQSLNCGFGSDDDPQLVAINQGRAQDALGIGSSTLVTIRQIHSARALIVTEPWAREASPEGDALLTDRPGIAVAVLSADCVPVLFADAKTRVVAAAHAGWRGTVGGVLEATVDAMRRLGCTDGIMATIGPCIRQQSYEVGPEFPAQFADAVTFFRPSVKPEHWMFDLPGYIAERLGRLGLASIDDLGQDTVSQETRMFSYRRSVLRGEPGYGRMISIIGLVDGV